MHLSAKMASSWHRPPPLGTSPRLRASLHEGQAGKPTGMHPVRPALLLVPHPEASAAAQPQACLSTSAGLGHQGVQSGSDSGGGAAWGPVTGGWRHLSACLATCHASRLEHLLSAGEGFRGEASALSLFACREF